MTVSKRTDRSVRLIVNGVDRSVPEATSLAVALLSSGSPDAHGELSSAPVQRMRVFCGMGSCYECVVTVDGVRGVRACITPVADRMQVEIAPTPIQGGGR